MIRLARVLEQSGNTYYRTVIQDMQADEEEKLVLTAITALQSAGNVDTIDALVDAYDNSDNRAVHERIVYVLDRSQTQLAADKLIDIARHDRSDDIRTIATKALGKKIHLPSTFTIIESRLNQEIAFKLQNPALTGIDHEKIARALKDIAVEDKNSTVRNAAFTALANAPADIALEFIIDTATSGDDYNVRRLAIEALGRSDDPRAREALIDIISSQK